MKIKDILNKKFFTFINIMCRVDKKSKKIAVINPDIARANSESSFQSFSKTKFLSALFLTVTEISTAHTMRYAYKDNICMGF